MGHQDVLFFATDHSAWKTWKALLLLLFLLLLLLLTFVDTTALVFKSRCH